MNSTLMMIGSLIFAFAAKPAGAGPSTGGGGFVVTCAENILEPARVELLDMYEGRVNLGFTMAQASGDLSKDYWAAVNRTYSLQGDPNLADKLKKDIEENLKKFARIIRFVDSEHLLPQADDLGKIPYIPSSCKIRQIAFFVDQEQTVYVLKSLWDQLDSANQVALILHETAFHHTRSLGEVTSEYARRVVVHMMAISGPVPFKKGIPDDAPSYITRQKLFPQADSSGISVFWTFPMYGSEKVRRLQFSQIFGRPLLTATWAYLPYFDWEFKFGKLNSNPHVMGCLLQTPNLEGEVTSPLEGTQMEGYSIGLKYKTGEPLLLSLKHGQRILEKGYIGSGPQCR